MTKIVKVYLRDVWCCLRRLRYRRVPVEPDKVVKIEGTKGHPVNNGQALSQGACRSSNG